MESRSGFCASRGGTRVYIGTMAQSVKTALQSGQLVLKAPSPVDCITSDRLTSHVQCAQEYQDLECSLS
jgi:hypothetical protein